MSSLTDPYRPARHFPVLFSEQGPIYVLAVHLTSDELSDWKKKIEKHGGHTVEKPEMARLIVANINTTARAQLELRRRGLPDITVVKTAWITASLGAGQPLSTRAFTVFSPSLPNQPCGSGKERREQKRSLSPHSPQRKQKKTKPALSSELADVYANRLSCFRKHPVTCPNEELSQELMRIRHIRKLSGNEIGVRAYSTAIAAIRAYPNRIIDAEELSGVPGCGTKIVKLVAEYLETGSISSETSKLVSDPELQAINSMYEIYGAGPHTARDWYIKRGWKSLSDVREHGAGILWPNQQIGLKHVEDFRSRMSRSEIEAIAGYISNRAQSVAPGVEVIICGSYRRGKPDSSDIDLVLSVRDDGPEKHHDLLRGVLSSLNEDGMVANVLKVATASTDINSTWNSGRKLFGPDIASNLVDYVLLNCRWPPGPTGAFRRIDLVCSHWSVVGCAVAAWTGHTTFGRDMRLHCMARGLTFSAGGLVSRSTNELVDTSAESITEAERRLFEVLQLPYWAPEDRNTG
ncbi:uncharacterized protein V1510DRAFT_282874 [Dipodascopsis tothii]|uniref:uncharacterized protein n=1 Tax=Dipodascopsis tothii TaxID=44089 RepID=UPI0034CE586F